MTDARSTHMPGWSGGIAEVTGSLIVDTQLRDVQFFSVTLAEAASATEAIVNGVLGDPEVGGHQKLTLQVFAVDGATPGASAVKVSWAAHSK